MNLCDLFVGIGLHRELLGFEFLFDDAHLGLGLGGNAVGFTFFSSASARDLFNSTSWSASFLSRSCVRNSGRRRCHESEF